MEYTGFSAFICQNCYTDDIAIRDESNPLSDIICKLCGQVGTAYTEDDSNG